MEILIRGGIFFFASSSSSFPTSTFYSLRYNNSLNHDKNQETNEGGWARGGQGYLGRGKVGGARAEKSAPKDATYFFFDRCSAAWAEPYYPVICCTKG